MRSRYRCLCLTRPRRVRAGAPRATTTVRAATGTRIDPRSKSSREREARDVPEGGDTVSPVDLLPFRVRAAAVADLHLEDARARLSQACRHLGLEAKAVGLELRQNDLARQIPPHGF